MLLVVIVYVLVLVLKIYKFYIFIIVFRFFLLFIVYFFIDLYQDKKLVGVFYNCFDNLDIYKRRKNINNIVEFCDLVDFIYLRIDVLVYVWCNI